MSHSTAEGRGNATRIVAEVALIFAVVVGTKWVGDTFALKGAGSIAINTIGSDPLRGYMPSVRLRGGQYGNSFLTMPVALHVHTTKAIVLEECPFRQCPPLFSAG